MKSSLQKNSTPIHPIQHSSSSIQSVPTLIAMTTRALSLGSVCIQSEWDFCKDSSGLHLFCLPHQSSIHTEMAGTKRKTPWCQKWEYRVEFLRIGKHQIAKRWNTHSKSKKGGWQCLKIATCSGNYVECNFIWKTQSLNTWQVLVALVQVYVSKGGFWLYANYTQSSKHIWTGFRRSVLWQYFWNDSTLLFQLINLSWE